MKNIFILSLLSIISIPAYSDVKSIEWYEKNTQDRISQVEMCQADKNLMVTQSCRNAVYAQAVIMSEAGKTK